jgi:hypothetical protein
VADGTPEQLQKDQSHTPSVILRLAQAPSPTQQDCLGTLNAQSWVAEAKLHPVAAAAEMEFEVKGKGGEDLRPLVVALALEKRWPMLEVRRDLLDIEGIFRRSTQE